MAYDNTDGRLRGRALTAARLRIWSRNPHCAMCGKLVDLAYNSRDPFELDHIEMVSKSKDNSDENLQVLCIECHVKKTAQDMGYKERVEFDTSGRVVW